MVASPDRHRSGQKGRHIYSIETGSEKKRSDREVDAFENPTELFQWISYGDWESAISRALSCPSEVSTWIVSRVSFDTKGKKKDVGKIKWKYLPLHLVCMRLNAPKSLVEVLLGIYPRAAMCRDREGNLPVHLLCSEGSENTEILDLLLDAYPGSVEKRDGHRRKLPQIIEERGCLVDAKTTQDFMDVIHRRMKERIDIACDRSRDEEDHTTYCPETPITGKILHIHTGSNRQKETKNSSDHVKKKKIGYAQSKETAKKDEIFNERVSNLEQKLEDSTTERDLLRDQVAALNKENQKLRAKVKELANNASRSKKEKDENVSIVSTLESDLSEARDKLTKDKNTISKLHSHIKKLEADASSQFESLRHRVDLVTKERNGYKDQLEEQEAQFDEKISAVREALSQQSFSFACSTIDNDSIANLVGEGYEVQATRNDLNRDIQRIKRESESVESKLRSKINSLEAELSEKLDRGRTNSLQQNNDELHQLCRSLQEQLSDLKERNTMGEIERMREKFENAEKEMQSKIISLETELSAARQASHVNQNDSDKTLEKKCKSLQEQLSDVKEQNNSIERKLALVTNERDVLHVSLVKKSVSSIEKKGRQNIKNAEYERKIKEMEGALSQSNATYQIKVEELTNRAEYLKDQNTSLQQQNEELSEKMREYVENGENLGEMSRQQAENQELLLRQMSEKAAAYSRHVKELVAKLDKLQNENISLRNLVKKNNVMYLAKIEQLKKEYDELNKTNSALKDAMKEMVQSKVTNLKKSQLPPQDMTSDTMREAYRGLLSNDVSWSTENSSGKDSTISTKYSETKDVRDQKYDELKKSNFALKETMKEIVQSKVANLKRSQPPLQDTTSDTAYGGIFSNDDVSWFTDKSGEKDSQASTKYTMTSDIRDQKYNELKKTNAALKEALKEMSQPKVAKLHEAEDSSLGLVSRTKRESYKRIYSIDDVSWSTDSSREKDSRTTS